MLGCEDRGPSGWPLVSIIEEDEGRFLDLLSSLFSWSCSERYGLRYLTDVLALLLSNDICGVGGVGSSSESERLLGRFYRH